MFDDSELPDFDSMSQEELIEWLEELAKSQSEAASEFIDDFEDDAEEIEADISADEPEVEWSDRLDDTQPVAGEEPPRTVTDITVGDNFEDVDEETPVDLDQFIKRESAPLDADAMEWLAEISAADVEEELPDISDYQPPEPQHESLDELLAQGAEEDPLDWLDSLANEVGGAAATVPTVEARDDGDVDYEYGDDFDDAYEDDEKLDDLEDESLYSRRRAGPMTVRDALLGLEDRESEKFSTQSMAPVPDNVEPAQEPASADVAENVVVVQPEAAPNPGDSLTQAFLIQDQQADLEAWYNSRLSAIAADGDRATQAPAIPPLPQSLAPTKPPPPGLAAAINSARRKVQANDLPEALLDYEKLLRSSAGLDWVVSDIRDLLSQDKFRENPSVHRVLGDALMRQGHLDSALDVYRHALSLL